MKKHYFQHGIGKRRLEELNDNGFIISNITYKRIIGSILLMLPTLFVLAQSEIYTPASVISLGKATVSLDLIENTSINPASAATKKSVVGISFSNKYQISGLSAFSLANITAIKNSALIVNLNTFGNNVYRANFLEIGIAKPLFIKDLNFGISTKYYKNTIIDQHNEILSITLGTQYKQETYGFGLSIINQTLFNINNDLEIKLPSLMSFGGHRIFREVMVCGQISMLDYSDLSLNIGLQYQLKKNIKLRLGYQSLNSLVSFGIGGQINGFKLDIAMSLHQYLGISPALSLYYE